MRPRAIFITATFAFLCPALIFTKPAAAPPCLMQPAYRTMTFPQRGFEWLKDEDLSGPCADVAGKNWIRKASGAQQMFVAVEGPAGSGRFWIVTVGVGGRHARKPERGACFTTSTLGWRTLQSYKKTPLAWLDDIDSDGQSELIVWTSFALNPDAGEAEYGLVAWVYQVKGDGSLALDWAQSRKMAREIAAAYAQPLDPMPAPLGELRRQAAEALGAFAADGCTVAPSPQSSVLSNQ